jgi:hypothetical protein
MALNEVPGIPQHYYCLLLGMTSRDLDAKSSVCRPQAAVAQQCQSVAAGPAGSAPGPTNTIASLAESKQNTNDKLKAYSTDIMWIITGSLVLR